MSDKPETINSGAAPAGNRRRNNYRRFRNKRSFPECPICGQSVKFLLTAISVGEENNPAHFDCVLKSISEKEELGPREKITYIGNGDFAIVTGKPGKDIKIRKKIQFENKELKGDWRKRISRNLKNR
ncbi:MAG: hypothetical protein L3J12_08950 [Spirochaetales bacterium]|nr:hypothetical protein [Spirochaetales bacterium]